MAAKQTELLIQESFAQLYQKKNWRNITVTEICKEAGISRATFYTYYQNISELLDQIESTTRSDVAKIRRRWSNFDYTNMDFDRPAPVYLEIYHYVQQHQSIYNALFGNYADARFILEYYEDVKDHFLSIAKSHSLSSPRLDLLASMYAGGIYGLGRMVANEGKDISLMDMAYFNTYAVLDMLKTASYDEHKQDVGEDFREMSYLSRSVLYKVPRRLAR